MNIRRILDASSFLARLADELERGKRYGRRFSLVVHQTPASLPPSERLKLLSWGVTVARGHTRISDVIGSFPDDALFAMILPETDAASADVVRQRFTPQFDRLPSTREARATGWTDTVSTYPEDAVVIEAFLARMDKTVPGLIESGRGPFFFPSPNYN